MSAFSANNFPTKFKKQENKTCIKPIKIKPVIHLDELLVQYLFPSEFSTHMK